MKLLILGLTLATLSVPAWSDGEVSGTAYTLTLRVSTPGPGISLSISGRAFNMRQAPDRTQRHPRGIIRLVDAEAKRAIAQAEFDERLGGYFFQLPIEGRDGPVERCLAFADARGQLLTVRQPSAMDNGVLFRNPAWDAERTRQADLAALKAERNSTAAQLATAAREVDQLKAEIDLPPGSTPADCRTPPEPPAPARPPNAIEAKDALAASGPACALRWEREHGARVQLGRMFSDAGVASDWQQRAQGADLLERLPDLKIPIAGQDLPLVLDAAAKGKTYLEHTDGVRLFSRAHAACRAEVTRLATAGRDAWARAIADAREFPQRARQECVKKFARVVQLQTMQASGPAFLAALDQRIAQRSEAARANDSVALNDQVCHSTR